MSNTTETPQGMRVLVVGSRRLERAGYVRSVLNLFHRQFEIGTIITGSFSGSDAATRSWAKENGMPLQVIEVPGHEQLERSFFNMERNIPETLMFKDPVFSAAIRKVQETHPTMIFLVPSPEGKLGATASCFGKLAKHLNIEVFDGEKHFEAINHLMDELLQAENAQGLESAIGTNVAPESAPSVAQESKKMHM